jgi:hypothetical protein
MKIMEQLLETLGDHFGGLEGKVDLDDYVHLHGTPIQALLYSGLFLPKLVMIDDCVLLSWNVADEEAESRFRAALRDPSKTRAEVEACFNLIEVGYLFRPSSRVTTDDEDILLANLLCLSWRGWLKTCFPERNFAVDVLTCEMTGSTAGVQFYQVC